MCSKKQKKLRFLCAGAGDGQLKSTTMKGVLFSTMNEGRNELKISATNELIKVLRPKHVMIDSGGYQIYSAEQKKIPMTFDPKSPLKNSRRYFNLAPEHVVNSAIKMKADSMVALDFPIRKIRNQDDQEIEFKRKLPQNVSWALKTARLRKKFCPNIELFIPVQAYNLKQFEIFYKKIKKVDFDGFSLPVRNMSILDIATFLLKMYEWGIRKVHILGSSSLSVISLCAYMSRFFDWISFDSTTWRISAYHGIFLLPHDLSIQRLTKEWSYDHSYCCQCNSCQGRTLAHLAVLDRKERKKVLMAHNYIVIQNLTDRLGKANFDSKYLRKILSGSKRSDVEKIIRNISAVENLCSAPLN